MQIKVVKLIEEAKAGYYGWLFTNNAGITAICNQYEIHESRKSYTH